MTNIHPTLQQALAPFVTRDRIAELIGRNIVMNNDMLTTLRSLPPDQQKIYAPQVEAFIKNTERIVKRLRGEQD
jgi:hypothetical protein